MVRHLPGIDVDGEEVGRIKFADVSQWRQRFGNVLVMEIEIDCVWIKFERDYPGGKQRLHFRSKQELPVLFVKVEWLLAHAITGQDQAALFTVPQGEGKHPAKMLETIESVL